MRSNRSHIMWKIGECESLRFNNKNGPFTQCVCRFEN